MSATASRLPIRWMIGGLLVVAVLGLGIWYQFVRPDTSDSQGPPLGTGVALQPDPPPPDPRLSFDTPFHNVKPGVKYLGDAVCATCHIEIDHTYHKHPMGRSATFTAQSGALEKYDAAAKNPFTVAPYELRVEKSADRVRHAVSAKDASVTGLPEYVVSADVTIGSGTRGRSYVTFEHGAAWQSPLSWFTSTAAWDLSPGFDLSYGGRRPILPGCLYCHVDRVEPVPYAHNRFTEPLLKGQANIGCERCHGPGELHVAAREARKFTGRDDTIVNPRYLSSELRTDICRQCHLQGQVVVERRGRSAFEFRPGLPWDQFVSVFMRHPDVSDSNKSVGQFEQMAQSKCFTASNGKLDCTSCHDPHVRPEGPAAAQFFRARCLTCHEKQGCSAPMPVRQAKADSCVACHMPKGDSTSIIHAAVTNHRVPRTLDQPIRKPKGMIPGTIPLVPYRPGPHAPPAEERERDFGIALGRLSESVPSGMRDLRSMLGAFAEERLSDSLKRWPGDSAAWEAMAAARGSREDSAGMLEAARNAVALTPDSEFGLNRLVTAAAADGKPDEALLAADRLVEMVPGSVDHRLTRAAVQVQLGSWERAETDCRAALKIHPLHPRSHMMLGICLHRLGDPNAGQRELEVAIRLTPSEQLKMAFRDQYRRQTR